jgi:1-acyl-sn-glycerol-3-phosphate acyltransferase
MIDKVIAQTVVMCARLLTGLRVRWIDGVPITVQTIFVANHSSHGDFVLVWAALPPDLRARTRPVAAADYWSSAGVKGFLAGQVFKAVLIDRLRSGDGPRPLTAMNEALASGDNLILFPEGTRNTTNAALLPLKRGVYELAKTHPQAAVVPIWIENLRRVLPKGSLIPVPLACTVSFGAALPVLPDESADAYLERLRQAMLACRPSSAVDD